MVSSPTPSSTLITASGSSRESTSAARRPRGGPAEVTGAGVVVTVLSPQRAGPLGGDLHLQFEHRVEQPLGTRRATGQIHIHRHHLVNALDDRVVVEHPSARGACAHADHPLGLGHLVVDLSEDGTHLWETRPATIIRSAWRGDARKTSQPNRDMS